MEKLEWRCLFGSTGLEERCGVHQWVESRPVLVNRPPANTLSSWSLSQQWNQPGADCDLHLLFCLLLWSNVLRCACVHACCARQCWTFSQLLRQKLWVFSFVVFWTPDTKQQTFPGWTWRPGTGPFPFPYNKTDETQSAITAKTITNQQNGETMRCWQTDEPYESSVDAWLFTALHTLSFWLLCVTLTSGVTQNFLKSINILVWDYKADGEGAWPECTGCWVRADGRERGTDVGTEDVCPATVLVKIFSTAFV